MNTLLDMSTNVGNWLSNELDSVGLLLEDHLNNKHDAVNEVCRYLSGYRGKMLRPSLVLLSWRSVQENSVVSEDVHRAAGVVELIHLATLVHDDVLDEADIRRGGQTINSLWGNECAVILGDYLLSSAFHLCSTIRNPDLNILLGEVTNTLCAGELVQLYHRNDVGLALSEYYQIIRDKTASLISAACKIGGILGGADKQTVYALGVFGNSVGAAFQIRDDLIDVLADSSSAGKPTGRDAAKGKMTLPAILMLKNNPACFSKLQEALENDDPTCLKTMLIESSSIKHSEETIYRLVREGVDSIESIRGNPSGKLLVELAEQLSKPI
ncbi:MAG TPA: polyprenyl synthetase family protein [Phycisphaerales bacterium]|nr:polyprenyl synthetase family protein [Phycisphaerales bacterium]